MALQRRNGGRRGGRRGGRSGGRRGGRRSGRSGGGSGGRPGVELRSIQAARRLGRHDPALRERACALAGCLPGACRPLRTMRPMSHPRPLAASPRRGWLWAGLLCALLASLLGSQWLGLLHAQLHPGAHARLQAVAHAHAGHPAQGPSWAGLPPEPGDEAPHAHAAHAGSGAGGSLLLELLELLDQHEVGSAACQLLDQLGHAAPSDGLVLLSPPSWGLLQQADRASVGPRRQAWTRPPARAPPSVG